MWIIMGYHVTRFWISTSYYKNQLYSRLGKGFSPGFLTRTSNLGLKVRDLQSRVQQPVLKSLQGGKLIGASKINLAIGMSHLKIKFWDVNTFFNMFVHILNFPAIFLDFASIYCKFSRFENIFISSQTGRHHPDSGRPRLLRRW